VAVLGAEVVGVVAPELFAADAAEVSVLLLFDFADRLPEGLRAVLIAQGGALLCFGLQKIQDALSLDRGRRSSRTIVSFGLRRVSLEGVALGAPLSAVMITSPAGAQFSVRGCARIDEPDVT
jgi:hypothetical protein